VAAGTEPGDIDRTVAGTEPGDIGRAVAGMELGDIDRTVADTQPGDIGRSGTCDTKLLLTLDDSLSLDDMEYSDIPSLLHVQLDDVPSLLLHHVRGDERVLCGDGSVVSRRDEGPMWNLLSSD